MRRTILFAVVAVLLVAGVAQADSTSRVIMVWVGPQGTGNMEEPTFAQCQVDRPLVEANMPGYKTYCLRLTEKEFVKLGKVDRRPGWGN